MVGKRILVVEDEDRVRDVWVDALQEVGYTVTGFEFGADALGRLPELTPDLILLDMMMPEMEGFEFLARLRRNPGWAHVPVLVVSALGDDLRCSIDPAAAKTLGVAGVLTKPVDLETLLGEVGRVIGPSAT